MKNTRATAKLLLIFHLFVCCVWLYLFNSVGRPPIWTLHVFVLSILGIQFTWGFTVGLIVGPARKRRPLLWFSLLTISMPLWFSSILFRGLIEGLGLPLALLYLGVFVAILACETYGGVLMGAKTHSENAEE